MKIEPIEKQPSPAPGTPAHAQGVERSLRRRCQSSNLTTSLSSSLNDANVLDAAASVREYSMSQLSLLSEVNFKNLARSLIDTIQHCPRGEIQEALVEWCDANFPGSENSTVDYREFCIRLVVAIGMELLNSLKFARIGLAVYIHHANKQRNRLSSSLSPKMDNRF